MKVKAIFLSIILIQGCSSLTKFQTPFSVEDPTIKGKSIAASGTMISSTQKRYWYSYMHALKKGGYDVEDSNDFPGFTTNGLIGPLQDKDANFQFWKEGQVYAKSLCTDFFRRISLAKAHRDFAKKEVNIIGGLVTAAMGLLSSSAEFVGATGLVFSSTEASFESYDSSYLVTPNLGLMETLVKEMQAKKSREVTKDNLEYVSDVITHLNEFVYPCTYTGMQTLLDSSLNKKIEEIKGK